MRARLPYYPVFLFLVWSCLTSVTWAQEASFTPSDKPNSKGCGFNVFVFTNTSDAGATRFEWTLGNGNTATTTGLGETVEALYSSGSYTVTLKAIYPGGVEKTASQQVTVAEKPLIQEIIAQPESGCAPLSVKFDADIVADANIIDYTWDFGDKASAKEPSPTHEYTAEGTYTVTLRIVDENRCITQQTTEVTVGKELAISFVTEGATFACVPPLSVKFTAEGTETGKSYTYRWNFGDGSPELLTQDAETTHEYTQNGIFSVTLTVLDPELGCEATYSVENQVAIQPLVADFEVTNISNGCTPTEVTFENTSTLINDTQIVTWNYGDGESETGPATELRNPSHVYTSSGVYSVTLTIDDPVNGCTDEVTRTDIVEILEGPVAAFTADNTGACAGPINVNFTNQSTNAVEWYWDFGNGQTFDGQNPGSITFNEGSYTVTLIVVGANGCADTLQQTNFITVKEPVADFTAFDVGGCAPDFFLNLVDSSSSPVGIASYDWKVINSRTGVEVATSTAKDPTLQVSDTGTYHVELTITTPDGCTSTEIKENYVKVGVRPNSLDFTVSVREICNGTLVDFDEGASVLNPDNPYDVDFYWNYISGDERMDQNGFYEYTNMDPGPYKVTLFYESNGCKDTLAIDSAVFVKLPKAQASNYRFPCVGDSIYFVDESYGADSLVWTFEFVEDPSLNFTTEEKNPAVFIPPGQTVNWTFQVWNYCDPSDPYTNCDGKSEGEIGCDDITNGTVTMPFNSAPVFDGNVFAQPQSGIPACAPAEFDFRTSISLPGTSITRFDWDFGNNMTGQGSDISQVVYKEPGTYSVKLSITTADGCQYDTTFVDMIEVFGPVVKFDYCRAGTCVGDSVLFQDQSTSIVPIQTRIWDFGDGNTLEINDPSETTIYYQYPQAKDPNKQDEHYWVTLTVIDEMGCVGVDSAKVRPTQPKAVIDSVNRVPVCGGDEITFVASMDSTLGLKPFTFQWEFSTGNSGGGERVTETFPAGEHWAQLIMFDQNFCPDTTEVNFTVVTDSLVADFPEDKIVGACPPLQANFTDQSFILDKLPDNEIVFWRWEFGDGDFIEGNQNPEKFYYAPGTYDVTLIVGDALGCFDTLTREDLVMVGGPDAEVDLGQTDTIGYVSHTIDLSVDVATGSDFTYIWDFGDGTTENTTDLDITHTYTTPGTFKVTLGIIDNASGCQVFNLFEQRIIVLPCPESELTDITQCRTDGQIVLKPFDETFEPDVGELSLIWTKEGAVVATGVDSLVIDPPPVGSPELGQAIAYKIAIEIKETNPDGTEVISCVGEATSIVTITDNPSAEFDISPACVGDPVVFTAINQNAQYLYFWDLDGDEVYDEKINETSPEFIYNQASVFEVGLVLSSGACADTVRKSVMVYEPPVADFEVPEVCQGEAVVFDARPSTVDPGRATTYQWEFEEGAGFTAPSGNKESSPPYVYGTAGTYKVTLKVNYDIGCSNQITKEILVEPAPIPDFDFTQVCVGTATAFTNLTLGTGLNYEWDFGDNSDVDITANPTHVYDFPGEYKVKLTATTQGGCEETIEKTVHVFSAPQPDFILPEPICVGQEVTLEGVDNSGNIIDQWEWSFSDGSTSNSQVTPKTFSAEGTFTITLKLISDNQCEASVQKEITVHPVPDVAFTATEACDGQTVNFAISQNNGAAISAYAWDFDTSDGIQVDATTMNPSHAYAGPGAYEVQLTVTSEEGCESTVTQTVNVTSASTPPAVTLNGPVLVCVDTEVEYTADPGFDSYLWTFSDGTTITTTEEKVTHTFAIGMDGNNQFTVNLLAEANGCSASDELTVEAVKANAFFEVTQACSGSEVKFTAKPEIEPGLPVASYEWIISGNGINESGSGKDFMVLINNPGSYEVTLRVKVDGAECIAERSRFVTIHPSPEAEIAVTSACEEKVLLEAKGITGTVTRYDWIFPNETITKNNPFVEWTPDSPGVKDVKLIVYSDEGCTYETSKQITIAPKPQATIEITNACAGKETIFQLNLDNNTANLTKVTWVFDETAEPIVVTANFGDPVRRVFERLGFHEVVVTLEGEEGCSVTYTKKDVEVYATPEVEFTFTELCDGNIRFTDNSVLNGTSVEESAYQWDFDNDGNTDATGKEVEVSRDTYFPENGESYPVILTLLTTEGCTATASREVEIEVTKFVEGDKDRVVCAGENITIIAKGGDLYHLRLKGDNNPNPIASNPDGSFTFNPEDFSLKKTQTYIVEIVEVIGGEKCILSEEVNVTVIKFQLAAELEDQEVCGGEPITFDAAIADPGAYDRVIYEWSDETTVVQRSTASTLTVTESGEYSVVISAEKLGLTCQSEELTVSALFYTVPSSTLPDTVIRHCFETQEVLTLNAAVEGGGNYAYKWEHSNETTPSVDIRDGGEYIVTITDLGNALQCVRTDTVVVEAVCPVRVFMPDAFTPNGDGLNDTFTAKGAFFRNYRLTIFNRWGEVIYRTNKPEEGWDGTYLGELMPSGVFPYMLEFIAEWDGEKHTQYGHVTLVR
ncbi:PKD domain-containing protein [Rapidithrix thailandica]|uniref:PKD domain-containing protein n=1 Tax=Rapidithrix thailandica TaxID=413964 RepID=A0AAW9S9M6_9BACT